MDDFISREAALEAFGVWADAKVKTNVSIKEVLNALPAADVKPVVKGEWIRVIAPWIEKYWCSECKDVTGKRSNFCPNCGADMRKEANDDA